MKKKILSVLMAVPIIVPFLASCSALHVHTFTSPYETDETSHWKTCSICHQKFDQHSHVFNEVNDKCFICDYTDPLVYVDENQQMTGLTPYGKTKYTINLPKNVKSIAPEAFKDSDAVTVRLNKELDYYYETSFSGSHVKTITTEESMVKWEDPDITTGIIKKIRVLDGNVAKIDEEYYPTLREAFEAVEMDDTTITLLSDKYDLLASAPIEVDHTINLEPLYDNTMLSCDFDIANNGILYVPETITYEGNARLLLTIVDEKRADVPEYHDYTNKTEPVYSSGSIVFVNKDECPIRANVTYVKSFREIGDAGGYPAVGAKQVANELLLIPHNHFAFGTVRFSKTFESIKGLTKYGQTVTNLTINSPIKGVSFAIGKGAFSIGYRFPIVLPLVDDIQLRMFRTKGFFTHLTIGEGITAINDYAFNNRIDGDIPSSIVKQLPIVFSHLMSVRLGDDLKKIGEMAFYDNVSITSVTGGAKLESIASKAFGGNISLTTVDFARSSKIKELNCDVFGGCSSLSYLALPPGLWKCIRKAGNLEEELKLCSYFPFDMTPERMASEFAVEVDTRDPFEYVSEDIWHRTDLKTEPIYYTKSNKRDGAGRFDEVASTDNIFSALIGCANGGEIYISEEYKGTSHTINLPVNKSLTINVAPKFTDFTVKKDGKSDITIEEGHYLMLNNIKPKGKVTLKTNDGNYPEKINNTAGFAIKGVDSQDIPQVDLVGENGEINIENLLSTEANIHNEAYDAYGIFNFTIKSDGEGKYTDITDTSPFGDKATSITYAHQTKDATRVKVDNGTTKNNDVTHITFSSDVESIAAEAFYDFNNIESIMCEEGLKTIGDSAFDGCDGLTSVILPNSLTSLGKKAFLDCDVLTSINIPTGLTSISEECFKKCPNLEIIDIPNSIETIGKEAFAGCEALSSIKFPGNLKTIGESSFSGCSALEKIYIADNSQLTTIGANAFSNCKSLNFAYFGENTTTDWTVPGDPDPISISPSDLSDSSKAALLLATTHVDKEWTRNLANL